jgi:hypothetical protein
MWMNPVGAYAVYQQYSWDETQMKDMVDVKLRK